MKESFNILSSVSNFLNEKRFVYMAGGEPNKPDVVFTEAEAKTDLELAEMPKKYRDMYENSENIKAAKKNGAKEASKKKLKMVPKSSPGEELANKRANEAMKHILKMEKDNKPLKDFFAGSDTDTATTEVASNPKRKPSKTSKKGLSQ
jgi:hypothetical protein